MPDHLPGTRFTRFLFGLVYLAFISSMIAQGTRQPFWVIFAVVFSGAVFTCGLALWWLTLWALRKDARWGQFGLGSLLFLTAFVAIYFSAVRWLVTMLPNVQRAATLPNIAPQDTQPWAFLQIAMWGLIIVVVSIPYMLVMTDGLLWAAVWLVKQPALRRFRKKIRESTDGRG